jgi:hypothetical protein
MRAVSSEFDSFNPTESFLGVLDQFAALRTYSGAAADVGGYRVLSPKLRRAKRKPARAPEFNSATIAALARARMRLTGFLSVLFVGGLGLAVLAGPANCPCSNPVNLADRSVAERLGYVETARLTNTRERLAGAADLPVLGAATLVEPEANAASESAITTASLEPAREAVTSLDAAPSAIASGRLPSTIVPVADIGPTVQVAAASNIENDVPPTLPAIEVSTPRTREIVASDDDKPRVRHKRGVVRAYRTPIAKSQRPSAKDELLVQRAPRWAQQMYANPWQSQAFSYTR